MKRFLDLIPLIILVLLLTYIGTLVTFMYKLNETTKALNEVISIQYDMSKVLLKHEQILNNQKEYILKLKRNEK